MGKLTYIQWCDRTWSPWLGCRKVSPGCDNCYIVRTPALSFRGIKHGSQREDLSEAYWALPEQWNRAAVRNPIYRCPACNRVGTVNTVCPTESCTTFASEMAIVRPRVFPSLCDPFDAEVPLDWRLAFFDTIKSTPNLDWLLLTKRPENALKFYEEHVWRHSDARTLAPDRRADFTLKFLPNVWLGVSVEDQQRADERIPILLRIPARVRFLSVEPMLESVDLTSVGPNSRGASKRRGGGCNGEFVCNALTGEQPYYRESDGEPCVHWGEAIDWVIVGGESGPESRPCNVEWIRSIAHQCRDAYVRCFVKQLGSRPVVDIQDCRGGYLGFKRLDGIKHPKGGDLAEWPDDLHIREFPV